MTRRILYAGSIAVVTLAGLFLVAASPFALKPLTKFGSNWALLSNIGQTYGAISALLTAVGIPGIAISILLQLRESRRSRADVWRTHHSELLRMALEDPSLTEISHSSASLSIDERKQTIYINLQLEFWLMLWEIRQLPSDTLRVYAADLLKTDPGRRFWARFGPVRMSSTIGAHKERRFLEIIDDEYRHLAPDRREGVSPPSPQNRNREYVIAGIALMGISFALGSAWCRSGREKHLTRSASACKMAGREPALRSNVHAIRRRAAHLSAPIQRTNLAEPVKVSRLRSGEERSPGSSGILKVQIIGIFGVANGHNPRRGSHFGTVAVIHAANRLAPVCRHAAITCYRHSLFPNIL
jgi:hypothetical protein